MFFRNKKLDCHERAVVEQFRRAASACECTDDQCRRIHAKMWATIEELEEGCIQAGRSCYGFGHKFAIVFSSLALVLTLSIGTTMASDKSVPGDPLYPIDRAVEKIHLIISIDPDDRGRVILDQAHERAEELEILRLKTGIVDGDRSDRVSRIEILAREEPDYQSFASDAATQRKMLAQSIRRSQYAVNVQLSDSYSELEKIYYHQFMEVDEMAHQIEREEMRREMMRMRHKMLKSHQRIISEIARMQEARLGAPDTARTVPETRDFPDFPQ